MPWLASETNAVALRPSPQEGSRLGLFRRWIVALQALRQATCLERLRVHLMWPSVHDLALLCSLPRLRHLVFWRFMLEEEVAESTLAVLRKAMPHLCTLGVMWDTWDAFLDLVERAGPG